MKSKEKGVTRDSDYFFNTPSLTARKLLFYPTIIGHFEYEPDYFISRNHFDNFLIMLIEEGNCEIELQGVKYNASRGSLVFLDCYNEHKYGSKEKWKTLWVHFDGPMARAYYEHIIGNRGNVINLPDFLQIHNELYEIYNGFLKGDTIDEIQTSKHINTMLNMMIKQEKEAPSANLDGLKKSISYINEHFSEQNHLDKLAAIASLSPYHYLRVFKEATGLTPHQYVLESRISASKYLLSTTHISVKEIAYQIGFSSESSFCTCFRKREKMTPVSYRSRMQS